MPRFNFCIAVGETPNLLAHTSKIISGDNMEIIRCKMHAFVDERMNHAGHMAELEARCQAKVAMREHFLGNVPVSDSQVTSLSIGEYVGVPPKEGRGGDTTI